MIDRIWPAIVCLLLIALAVLNIVYTGRIHGIPFWFHWIAALALGAGAFYAGAEAVR